MPMSLTDLPLLAALKVKMKWHQGRQQVLAENIANADTPNFRARDLVAPDFRKMLAGRAGVASSGAALGPVRTNSAHLGGGAGGAGPGGGMKVTSADDWEKTPQGNAVVLEDEMLKISQNQMDYQMATTLYSRGLGLLRTAIGRRGG